MTTNHKKLQLSYIENNCLKEKIERAEDQLKTNINEQERVFNLTVHMVCVDSSVRKRNQVQGNQGQHADPTSSIRTSVDQWVASEQKLSRVCYFMRFHQIVQKKRPRTNIQGPSVASEEKPCSNYREPALCAAAVCSSEVSCVAILAFVNNTHVGRESAVDKVVA